MRLFAFFSLFLLVATIPNDKGAKIVNPKQRMAEQRHGQDPPMATMHLGELECNSIRIRGDSQAWQDCSGNGQD